MNEPPRLLLRLEMSGSKTRLPAVLGFVLGFLLGFLLAIGFVLGLADAARNAEAPDESGFLPAADTAGTVVAVTTANLRYTMTRRQVQSDLARARRGATIVLTQENYARPTVWFRTVLWEATRGRGDVARCRELVTSWRRDVWQRVGRRVAWLGGRRCALVVTLAHRVTGTRVTVVNLHLWARVEAAGGPRPGQHARVLAYGRAMTRLASVVDQVRVPLVVGGDWNVGCRADRRVKFQAFPWSHLAPLGLRPVCRGAGTLGNRHVDTLWRHGLTLETAATRRNTFSDHNQAFARFRLPATVNP